MTVWNALRVRALPALLGAALGVAWLVAPAQAAQEKPDKKVALVFGNAAYVSVPKLANPTTDGAAMAAMLQKAGFDVTSKQDATIGDMRKLVREFATKVSGADEVVVFYAGHGIEVDGTNYLIPVDAKLERDIDVEDEALPLDRIVRLIEPAKRLRLVLLDACRDNPFAPKMKRSLSRGVERGLAKVEPTTPNTLIAYAAKAGSTAADGDGPNGVFTTALLKQLPTPGQDLRKSLGYVRDDVLKMTENKQEPYVYGSLGGDDVVLVAAPPKPAAVPPQIASLDPNSQLRRDYELAAQVNTLAGWDAFLRTYSKGFYADLARAARGKLDTPVTHAAVSPDARNLSGPNAGSVPAKEDPGIAAQVGKSFRVSFVAKQIQASPEPGKIGYAPREFALYVKSPTEIASRFSDRPNMPANPGSRFALGAPGNVNRGIQVGYGDHQFQSIVQFQSHRLKTSIKVDGNACKADVTFELQPGEQNFRLFRTGSNEPLLMSEMIPERITCWVTPTDEVGQPPVAAAKPQ